MNQRNILIVILLGLTLVACGKKGDLEAPDRDRTDSTQSAQILDQSDR